jgi:prophage regulatory protein
MAVRNILRLPAVEKVSGHKKSQIYVLMAKGEFPRPVKLSEQSVGWFEDEIEAWQNKLDRAIGGWSPRSRKRQSTPDAGTEAA